LCRFSKGHGKVKCQCNGGFVISNSNSSIDIGAKGNITGSGGGNLSSSYQREKIVCDICKGSEWKKCGKCDGVNKSGPVYKCRKGDHILKHSGKWSFLEVCNKCGKSRGDNKYKCPKCFDTTYCIKKLAEKN